MGLSLKNNYLKLLEEIDHSVLIAVTKKRSLEQIRELYSLGQRDFGENRVEELSEKSQKLKELDINWHFIGNLQSKKISKLIRIDNLTHIHSIDRIKLIKLLADYQYSGKLFLQVNISGEREKSGFCGFEETKSALDHALSQNLKVEGLMGMAGIRVENQLESADNQFSALRLLRDRLNPELELSMGMSADYKQAMNNGAKYLRIGSSLFS